MRITKWKVAAIFVVVLVAIVIDGWSYVARVTSTRTSQVVSSSQDTTTSFAVTPERAAPSPPARASPWAATRR